MKFELISEWGAIIVILVPVLAAVVGGLVIVSRAAGDKHSK